MSSKRLCLSAGLLGAVCLAAAWIPSSAAAGYLGNWNSNRGCPVDDPAMLASPPGAYTACVGWFGGGPWKVGNLKLRMGLDAEFGVYGPTSAQLSQVPGPKMYPNEGSLDGVYLNNPILGACAGLPGSRPYDPNSPYAKCVALSQQTDPRQAFTPYIEQAGDPSAFSMAGAIGIGPALTFPVKIRLAGPAFGPDCYIGSDADPILLHLNGTRPIVSHSSSPDPNGYPVTSENYDSFADLVDLSFAVPAARGCGDAGQDAAINAAFGLPSASGNNSVTLDRFFSFQSTTAGGKKLAKAYHAALG